MLHRLLLPLTVVLALAAAAPAGAATVEAFHDPGTQDRYDDETDRFVVRGDAGADDLTVTSVPVSGGSSSVYDVVDPTRPVTAPAPCVAVDVHHVRCAPREAASLSVEAGDGDDRVTVDGGVSVSGGAGDDVLIATGAADAALSGGPGDDRVTGGPGADSLSGGDGDDQLDGGAGNDRLVGGAGRDALSGGAGSDTFTLTGAELGDGETLDGGPGGNDVTVADPGQPLWIDLASRRIASPRGITLLSGIENASASGLRPWLFGDDGPNVLTLSGTGHADGRGGDDRLADHGRPASLAPSTATLLGGPGDDDLAGLVGTTLDGGAGDDHLGGVLRAAPHLSCGDGVDVISGLEATARPADCEGMAVDRLGFLGALAVTPRAVRVPLQVDATAACGLVIGLTTAGGRALAVPARTRRVVGPLTLALPLTALGRRLLAGPRAAPPVRVAVREGRTCDTRSVWTYYPALAPSVLVRLPAAG
jgi:hypothetical protein